MEQKKVKTLRRSLEEKVAQGQLTNRHSLVADIGYINTDIIQYALDFEKVRRKISKVDGRSRYVRTMKKYYGV